MLRAIGTFVCPDGLRPELTLGLFVGIGVGGFHFTGGEFWFFHFSHFGLFVPEPFFFLFLPRHGVQID